MNRRRYPRRVLPKRRSQIPSTEFVLLDKFSVNSIRKWEVLRDEMSRFHWDYYSNLAFQRSKIVDSLRTALLEASEGPFVFGKWQRVVRYKHTLEPLSIEGSLIGLGGRFNIGDVNPAQFSPFPALYIAADKATAFQEFLGQNVKQDEEEQALDAALANPTSIGSISISGSLERVINLTHSERLEHFVSLIKDFSITLHLIAAAKKLGLPLPTLVRTPSKLLESLLAGNWRYWPMQFDVPATSQIFGQLVAEAGIEAVLYPSKFNEKNCLAIFCQNFGNSSSFVQLDDETPAGVRVKKLDAETWRSIKS